MEKFKTLIKLQDKTFFIVFMGLLFSILSLMVRIKLNKSFFYLFMMWNVFLAFIPYAITMYLNSKLKLGKIAFSFWFFVWLIFLPNAPYMVTDFIHLRLSIAELLWLDILVLLSFALCGLLLFYISLNQMKCLYNTILPRLNFNKALLPIIFLSSFGVYLGRFLRYNSWEIISNPNLLVSDIFEIITKPNQHIEAWLFTFGFGGFLIIGYWMFQLIITYHPQNPEGKQNV